MANRSRRPSRSWVVLAACCLGLLSCTDVTRQTSQTPGAPRSNLAAAARDPEVARAFKSLFERRFVDADSEFRGVLGRDPSNAAALLGLGTAYAGQGRHREAVEQFRQADELSPNTSAIQSEWGLSLLSLDQPENAAVRFRRSAALNPSNVNAVLGLGLAMMAQKQPGPAAQRFRAAATLTPAISTPYRAWAGAEAALGNLELARRLAELDSALIRGVPENLAQAHRQLAAGLVAYHRGQFDEAAAMFNRALAQDPNSIVAHMLLASLELRRQRNEAVIDVAKRGLLLDPRHAALHGTMAHALSRLKRFAEALDAYRRAAELDPTDARIADNLGIGYADVGRHAEALAEYKRANRLDPDLITVYYNAGGANLALNQFDTAADWFRRATERKPDYARAWRNWGLALHRLGRHDEAAEKLRRAQTLDFADTPTWQILADVEAARGNMTEAKRMRDSAILAPQIVGAFEQIAISPLWKGEVPTVPKSAEDFLQVGKALGLRGEYEKSFAALRRALELDPNLSEAHFALASVLLKAGNRDEARTAVRRAISLAPREWRNLLLAARIEALSGDNESAQRYRDAALTIMNAKPKSE